MSFLTALRAKRGPRAKKSATFLLVYSPPDEPTVKVGRLDFDGELWTFTYDEEYKRRTDLRPIEGFGDLQKIYRSPVLFPFFAVRIPHESRSDIQQRLANEHVRDRDESDLLRLFGRHVVSSPAFELIPVAA